MAIERRPRGLSKKVEEIFYKLKTFVRLLDRLKKEKTSRNRRKGNSFVVCFTLYLILHISKYARSATKIDERTKR